MIMQINGFKVWVSFTIYNSRRPVEFVEDSTVRPPDLIPVSDKWVFIYNFIVPFHIQSSYIYIISKTISILSYNWIDIVSNTQL